MSMAMSLVKVWSRHLQGFSTLWTCQPIHAVPPIMYIPLPQGSVCYLSAVSESGSGHSFLETLFVNHRCILHRMGIQLDAFSPYSSLFLAAGKIILFPHGTVSSIGPVVCNYSSLLCAPFSAI
ncbi:hypothetical protein EV424DRAFT_582775 [Suillus variegatus]|nr:hypothetical protein EV424DRAFT_582775 [Suillus variegatus]